MHREVLSHEDSFVSEWVCKAAQKTAKIGDVHLVSLHEHFTCGALQMEAILAVHCELDVGKIALSAIASTKIFSAAVVLIFSKSADLAMLWGGTTDVLDDDTVRLTLGEVVILYILGLLSEDDIIVNRWLHHVLVNSLAHSSLGSERIEDE